MSGNSSNEHDNLPPWLRDLQLPASPTPPASPSPSEPAASSDADDIPGWLRSYTDDDAQQITAGSAADVPDWLQEPQQPSTDLPDWLRDPEPMSGSEQPNDSLSAETDEQIPDWLRLTSADSVSPTGATETADVPDWLRESMEQRPSSDVPPPATPSWLSSEPAATSADWLTPAEPVQQSQEAASVPADDEDVPAWLRDVSLDEVREVMNTDSESSAIEPFSFDTGPTETPSRTGLPAWLQDEQAGTDDSAPSWLSDNAAPETPFRDEQPLEPFTFESDQSTTSGASAAPFTFGGDSDAPDEDVPSWLRPEVPSSAGEPAAPFTFGSDSDAPGEDVPSWLRPDSSTPSDAMRGGELAWLSMGTESEQTPAPASEPPPSQQDDDIPVWLRGFNLDAAPVPSEPASAAPPTQDTDLPDWLRGMPAEQDSPEATPSPPSFADDRALPAWMVDAPQQPAEPSVSRPEPIAEPDDVPAWLREDERDETSEAALPELPPWLQDEAGQALPTASDANLATWLRGADHRTDTPDEIPVPAEPAARSDATSSEFLGEGDLPVWLVDQPQTARRELNANDQASLDWLTRLNTTDDEGIAPSAAPAAPRLPLPAVARRTDAHVQAVALLSQIAATPYPDAKPLPDTAPVSFWRRVGIERVLYLLLLVGLIVSLTIPSLLAPLQVAPTDPGAAPLLEQVRALGPDDVVLIGYEWDARRVGELNPLKDAVIGQLIAQNVKMILVSTDPQGTLLSYDLRDELRAAGYNAGGSDYVLLGYKPGNELALRLLAQDLLDAMRVDFQGADATQGGLVGGIATGTPVQSIRDMSMVLVLADEANDVQGWMEQVRPQIGDIPMTLLLSAEAAPLAQPYTRLPNVYALSGQPGALAYQQLRAGDDAAATQAVATASAQQRLGLLVFTALLLLGGVAVGIAALTQRGMKRR